MEKTKLVYYQENDMWVGWLEEYPDYRSQGKTLDELRENLKDIYEELDDYENLRSLREAKAAEQDAPAIGIRELKKRLRIQAT